MSAKNVKFSKKIKEEKDDLDFELLERIAERALYYSTQMIHLANNREDDQKGDPKVGGHPAACASITHIMGALHLAAREPYDHMAVKPHGSPMDHAYHHLLQLFYNRQGQPFSRDEAKQVMHNLRKFGDPEDPNSAPVFQSYHAAWDPDSFNYFPSGTVGIPPVASAYMALAYRFAKDHGFEIPQQAHFWSIIGDSEFREGSLHECMPDVAERKLNSVTWIVDYNRQNLDGPRIKSENGMPGTDADRIERLALANGWQVFNVRHGKKREASFQKPGGELLRRIFETHLTDFELQALFLAKDGKVVRNRFLELEPGLKKFLTNVSDKEILEILLDMGGHDLSVLVDVFQKCRTATRPTLVIAHTIKGWHLECQAAPGNHSLLPDEEEVEALRESHKIPKDDPFQLFKDASPEAKFLKTRHEYMHEGIEEQRALKNRNLEKVNAQFENAGGFPEKFGIDLKLVPWGNTQWMWGQLAAKLIRIANAGTSLETSADKQQPLSSEDARWKPAAQFVVTMAPDVGTSTNLNPSMDHKIYAPGTKEDYEERYHVKDSRRPDLVPLEKQANRHLRFEIEEANAMTCAGSFGKMGDIVGVPFLPLMSIYDFFIKRAHDQFFYNIYWRSGFICIGTPSGVSLSPEGAQHSWKSDFQIPNLVTWEPAFALEMDWILADTVRRHFTGDNHNRQSVLLRAVTMGIEQKPFMESLKTQLCFQGMDDDAILETTRRNCLEGGYWLLNFEGYEGYCPGDNVVTIFAMGTLVPEALKASATLREQGIYGNVIVVTSPDLLVGSLGKATDFRHLRETLSINANMYLNPRTALHVGGANGSQLQVQNPVDMLALRGSRIPLVSSHDGEPGLLDNIGSIVGVPHEALAVRKHSKSGRPIDVFAYQHINASSIVEASMKVLTQAASEELIVNPQAMAVLPVATTTTTTSEPTAVSEPSEFDPSHTRH